jgi:hypothetical protein
MAHCLMHTGPAVCCLTQLQDYLVSVRLACLSLKRQPLFFAGVGRGIRAGFFFRGLGLCERFFLAYLQARQ